MKIYNTNKYFIYDIYSAQGADLNLEYDICAPHACESTIKPKQKPNVTKCM